MNTHFDKVPLAVQIKRLEQKILTRDVKQFDNWMVAPAIKDKQVVQ